MADGGGSRSGSSSSSSSSVSGMKSELRELGGGGGAGGVVVRDNLAILPQQLGEVRVRPESKMGSGMKSADRLGQKHK